MLRSLRLLLLTIVVSMSIPAVRCDAEKASAHYAGGPTPLKVEVRLQAASQPSLKPSPTPTATPSPTPTPKDVSEGTEETHPGSAPEGDEPRATPTPTPEPTPFSLYWVSDTQVYAYRYPTNTKTPWFDDYNYYMDEARDTFTLTEAW